MWHAGPYPGAQDPGAFEGVLTVCEGQGALSEQSWALQKGQVWGQACSPQTPGWQHRQKVLPELSMSLKQSSWLGSWCPPSGSAPSQWGHLGSAGGPCPALVPRGAVPTPAARSLWLGIPGSRAGAAVPGWAGGAAPAPLRSLP